jgi:hypothetical protein
VGPFVGRIATVVEKPGQDEQGCDLVKVDLDRSGHFWRVTNLTLVDIKRPDELQREITRRLALVYERYGAAEAEKTFLEKLHSAGVLEVRMRLRLTYLLFQGTLEECDRAERILLAEGVPIVFHPLPGDYTTELALSAAIAQLHQAGRHDSVLRLLAGRREFMVLDDVNGPTYVHHIAAACAAVDEAVHREIEGVLGGSPAAWWARLYDRLLGEERGLNHHGVPLLGRSASLMMDLERLWHLLSLLFSSRVRRPLLGTLDDTLTDFGLLLERSACRFVARVGSESYETLVEEGLQLVAEINRSVLVDLTVEAMLDQIESRRHFRHLERESRALLDEVFRLQRAWEPERRPDLRARALLAGGDYGAAWTIFETLPGGELSAEVEELLVECWANVGGASLEGKLTVDMVEELPERVRASGLAAATIEQALTAGRLIIDGNDATGNDAALEALVRMCVPDGAAQLCVRARAHLGNVFCFVGDLEYEAGWVEYAEWKWKLALEAWGQAIAQSIEREKPHGGLLGRKGRLLREEIELRGVSADCVHGFGLNLAKPQNSARLTLSDDLNGVGTCTHRSLFLCDHVFHPDCMAFSLGFSLPVHSQLRSKPFLCSFLPSGALCATSNRQASHFPADFSLQNALTLPENRLSLG